MTKLIKDITSLTMCNKICSLIKIVESFVCKLKQKIGKQNYYGTIIKLRVKTTIHSFWTICIIYLIIYTYLLQFDVRL